MSKPKTIMVTGKIVDLGIYELINDEDKVIARHDGYVPDFFPGDHFGDYLELEIDLETGKILNWKKPSKAEIKKFIAEASG